MAQAGSFVPAQEATIGLVDGIYTRWACISLVRLYMITLFAMVIHLFCSSVGL